MTDRDQDPWQSQALVGDHPVPHVVVIGGGITGLTAARRLRQAGLSTLVLEAADQVGGQIRARQLGGRSLDVGAEAMHLAVPGVAEVIEELELRESMVTARPGASWLVTPRGLRRLPEGVGPAGPTRLRPVLTSGVMTSLGLARAALEPVQARRRGGIDLGPGHDLSVGAFVTARFGRQVTQRLVDPLLGSLHAGDVSTLSLRACTPSLVPAARQGRSLVLRRRGVGGGVPMSFVTWPDGVGAVLRRVQHDRRFPVPVRTAARVNRLTLHQPGTGQPRYRLQLSSGEVVAADGVVLAVPAAEAAGLLRTLTGPAESIATAGRRVADLLDTVRAATVATVLAGYPRTAVREVAALRGTGILVPSQAGLILKAATFLSTKWPQLDDPQTVWIRMSAGRAGDQTVAERDDATLVDHLRRDLRALTGLDAHPHHLHVERWADAMPQLTVGHGDRITEARRILAEVPGATLAGASYDGIGLGACLRSATAAATTVAAAVTAGAPGRGRADRAGRAGEDQTEG